MTEQVDYDVLIVGAGISGIDAAYRIQTMSPDRSYAVLEGRASMGGTWDLFRYPGVRSDSDMYTLGFPFEPWQSNVSIAGGPSILSHIKATAAKHGIADRIRYGHNVTHASWASASATWTVDIDTPGGRTQLTSRWIHLASGYYDYENPHIPEFEGRDTFTGTFVHPQFWPADLEVAGKQVVVIGSGATAVTLVPALAAQGARVTMLQRSPSYVLALPGSDVIAAQLRKRLPAQRAHNLIRWKNIVTALGLYTLCRRAPRLVGRLLSRGAERATREAQMQPGTFRPRYDPWDERLCIVPDGDLFKALRHGTATIVTNTIDSLVPEGVRTSDGTILPADIIVSATGLTVRVGGGMTIDLDATPVDVPSKYLYRGLMLEEVPNLTFAIGYTNASWTLRADLSAQYVCRLLNHMRDTGAASAYPRPSRHLTPNPLLGLRSGYVLRAEAVLPKSGGVDPWQVHQSYLRDRKDLGSSDVTEDMVFVRVDALATA
ncbi:MAG: NAD(P)/FAD-dependent oxidoreductase [Nostocoides sp.]